MLLCLLAYSHLLEITLSFDVFEVKIYIYFVFLSPYFMLLLVFLSSMYISHFVAPTRLLGSQNFLLLYI